MPSRVLRSSAPWMLTTGALFALWLFFVDTVENPQLIVGAGVAAVGATGSELVRRQRVAQVRPRARWLLGLWRPLTSIPADLGRLIVAAGRGVVGRPPAGRLVEVSFDPGDGGAEDIARHAVAEFAGSFSPNTIVIGVDVERGTLLAHQLEPDDDPAGSIDPLGLGEESA